MSFRHSILVLDRLDCLPASVGRYKFPSAISFRICFSRDRSATSRSSSLNRLACSISRPPYSLRPSIVALLRYLGFLASLPDRSALARQHLDLTKLRDNLLRAWSLPSHLRMSFPARLSQSAWFKKTRSGHWGAMRAKCLTRSFRWVGMDRSRESLARFYFWPQVKAVIRVGAHLW